MKIKDTKILVVGGAGLIGSHLVDRLIKGNAKEIWIFDNFVRGSLENLAVSREDSRVKIFEAGGDICQMDILNKAIQGMDGVFCLAALWLLQCHEFPRAAFEVNVRGAFNVMEACVAHKVKRLVFSSSASVYGDPISLSPPTPLVFKSSIRLEDVKFRYSETGPWILDGLTLDISMGSRVGILGKTGCGKSTCLDLLSLS